MSQTLGVNARRDTCGISALALWCMDCRESRSVPLETLAKLRMFLGVRTFGALATHAYCSRCRRLGIEKNGTALMAEWGDLSRPTVTFLAS